MVSGFAASTAGVASHLQNFVLVLIALVDSSRQQRAGVRCWLLIIND